MDRSLEIRGGDTDHLGEISYRSDFRLSTPALRVNPGFFDLQAGEHLGLALALSLDVATFAPLLVSDRHSSDWPAKPRRFVDGRIDLGDTPIKVGDCSTLDPEASFDVCGFVGEGKSTDAMWSRWARVRKPNTPMAFNPINTPIIRTRMRRRRDGAEVQCSVSQAVATSFGPPALRP
jgi:hypothetical protein